MSKLPQHIRRIVIVRLSALGDVVMLVPTVRRLQQAYPQAEITWITSPLAHALLEGLSGVNFIVINKPSSLADYWRLRQLLSQQRYDICLAMQANLRVNFIYPMIRAPLKLGYDKQRAKEGHDFFINRRIDFAPQHLLESFLAFSDALGVESRELRWDLPIGEEDFQWARQHMPVGDGPVFVVNPAASKAERNWLVERYAEVVKQCVQQHGAQVIFTGGPSDEEKILVENIQAKAQVSAVNLTGKTTPKQLAAVLSLVDFVLAPDTGPAHLAVAMGTPVIGLYAVAPPALSAPYLSKHLVVNRYPEALQKFMGKSESEVPWVTRVHHSGAMALIQVKDVMQRIEIVLNQKIGSQKDGYARTTC